MIEILKPEIILLSDNAIMIDYSAEIKEIINQRICILCSEIKNRIDYLILDIVPGFHNIVITIDSLSVDILNAPER